MKSKEILQDENRKLTVFEKVVSASGGMTSTFVFQMVQMYLLFFYTDIFKINPLYIAGLFLVIRIIDAFITPVFGIIVDKVTTPWGKYKPWFVILGIPTAVFGFLTFTTVDLSSTGKLVYVTITYLVFSICGAVNQGPGAAMIPAMTKRLDDRVSLGTYNYIFVMIGAMTVVIGALPLINLLGKGNQAKGFSMLMLVAGIITIVISIAQFTFLKERFVIPRDKDTKYSFGQIADSILKNKTAIIALVFIFVLNLSSGLKSAIMIHYLKYFFHNEGLMTVLGIVGLVPTFLGVMISGVVTKKIGVKNNLVLGSIVSMITTAVVIFIPSTSGGVIAFIVFAVIGSFFSGMSMPVQGTLMPAAMDYSEWKTGINCNAFMGSVQGFMQNLATAASGAIAAIALSMIGYVPNVEQSSTTLFGLKVLMSILPAVIYAFTLIVCKFDLTEEKQKQIAHDLAERRKTAEA